MPFLSKKFHLRNVVEFLFGFFLLCPLILPKAAPLLPASFSPFFEAFTRIVSIPWHVLFFMSDDLDWTWIPYVVVTCFFIVHTFFSRERFPQALAAFHRVRPLFIILMLGYFASSVSRAGSQNLDWHKGTQWYLYGAGAPFKFVVEHPPLGPSQGFLVVDPLLFLANIGFYSLLFWLIWYAWKTAPCGIRRSGASK